MAITVTELGAYHREERDFAFSLGSIVIEVSIAPPQPASEPRRSRREAWDVAISYVDGHSEFSGLDRESGAKAFDLAVRLFTANSAQMNVQVSPAHWGEIRAELVQRGAFAP